MQVWVRKFARVVLMAVAALVLLTVLAVAGGISWIYWRYARAIPIPEPQGLIAASAANGACGPVDGRRQFVPLAHIPPVVRAAFLTAEPDLSARESINPFGELLQAVLLDGYRPRPTAISQMAARCLIGGTYKALQCGVGRAMRTAHPPRSGGWAVSYAAIRSRCP